MMALFTTRLVVFILVFPVILQGQQEASISYAKIAQRSNGQVNEQSLTSSTPRSYAQAANRNQGAIAALGNITPSPTRNYASAANNNRQQVITNRPYTRRPYTHNEQPTLSPAAASITDNDLLKFSEELLNSEVNNAANAIRVSFQARTYGSNHADLASQPLLFAPPRSLQAITISKLKTLFDNYEKDSTLAEVVTPAEQNENSAFLTAVMDTQVMIKTQQFLVNKSLIPTTPGYLQNLLKQLWFTMFPRAGGRTQLGSSSFEHVFLGEVHRGEVSGMHNWVFFNYEESNGRLDYRGYIKRLDLGGHGHVLKLNFRWGNVTKPVGSMFIGTSPELEMALYTVCFLARPNLRCPVKLSGQEFSIKTYTFTYHGKQYIGSAYPDI